jgi:transposase
MRRIDIIMSGKREKPYPSEFKESSVKLALESKDSIRQSANNLGIKASTLHTWISKYSKPKEPNVRTDEHIYDEVKKLKRELAKGARSRF